MRGAGESLTMATPQTKNKKVNKKECIRWRTIYVDPIVGRRIDDLMLKGEKIVKVVVKLSDVSGGGHVMVGVVVVGAVGREVGGCVGAGAVLWVVPW